MTKQKRGFWLLAGIFSLWFLFTLVLLWIDPGLNEARDNSMMGSSMASMMRDHIGSPTLMELLNSDNMSKMVPSTDGHHSLAGLMGQVHYLSTYVLYLTLPFIIGGTAFLLIVWIR